MSLTTPTLLDSQTDDRVGSSLTSGTISPAANSLLVVVYSMRRTADLALTPLTFSDTLTGTSSWSQESDQQFANSFLEVVGIGWAVTGSSPGSGTVTVTSNNDKNGEYRIIAVYEIENQAATPVPQSISGVNTSSSLTVNLASTPSGSSMVFGAVGTLDDAGVSPGSGFTELDELSTGSSTPNRLQTQYDNTSPTSGCSWSSLGTVSNVGVAIEIQSGKITADLDTTLGDPSFSAEALLLYGALATTLGQPSVNVDATMQFVADLATTLGDPSFSADGQLRPVANLDTQLGQPSVSADATMQFIADLVAGLGEPDVSIQVSVRPTATGESTLGALGIEGEIQVQLAGAGESQLGALDVQGSATSAAAGDDVLMRLERNGAVVPYQANSLTIRQQMSVCDVATFQLILRRDETFDLRVGDPIQVWLDSRQEDLLWAGTVDRYTEVDLVGAADYSRQLRVQCTCYTSYADRFYVTEVYENETAGDIARDLVAQYLAGDGVTTNNVVDGPEIEYASFPYLRVSEALNELADLTGYYWYIDAEKDLYFAPRTAAMAGLEITDSNRPYISLEINRGRDDYRNKQIVRAGKALTDERVENFIGDGARQTFNTAFPVGKVPTVRVNSVEQDVGIRGLTEDEDWFWSKGDTEISQNSADTPLTSSDTLEVTYQGLFPIVVRSRDKEAIADRAALEGGTGIYEDIVSAPAIDNIGAALERARGLLARYAQINEDLRLTTDETNLRKGELLRVSLTKQGVDDEYLIDNIQWSIRDDASFRVTVKALSGDSVGGWTRYFRKLQEAGREFVIRENEVLVLQRRTTSAAGVADSAGISSSSHGPFVVGTSDIGYGWIGDVEHHALPTTDTTTVADTATLSTGSIATLEVGTDEIGFAEID